VATELVVVIESFGAVLVVLWLDVTSAWLTLVWVHAATRGSGIGVLGDELCSDTAASALVACDTVTGKTVFVTVTARGVITASELAGSVTIRAAAVFVDVLVKCASAWAFEVV
jgi:hypothetical protein